jgi:hypothetical protein
MINTTTDFFHFMGLGHYCQQQDMNRITSWQLYDNIVIENGTKRMNQCESSNTIYINPSSFLSLPSSGTNLQQAEKSSSTSFDYCYQSKNTIASVFPCPTSESLNDTDYFDIINDTKKECFSLNSTNGLSGMTITDGFGKCDTSLSNEQTINDLIRLLHDTMIHDKRILFDVVH